MTTTRASSILDSDSVGIMLAPTHFSRLVELDVIPNSENFQFSNTLGKSVAYLESIKHPKVSNPELLDRVDQVSRTIAGCIELAEYTPRQSNHMKPKKI